MLSADSLHGGSVIEQAGPDDADEILAVINTTDREAYRAIIPKEHFVEPILSLDKLLEDFARMTFYVHRSEGRVVGVAALYVENEESGRVRWVFVLPEYQRQGIGTALVSHVERRAREMGLRRLRLVTPARAGWALRFYGRLGYEPAGEIENPWGMEVLLGKVL
jgi:GNAT superfamily N-acetyltransferase